MKDNKDISEGLIKNFAIVLKDIEIEEKYVNDLATEIIRTANEIDNKN